MIGAAERLEFNWTPRVKRAAEIAATVFAQNTARVTLGGGVLNVHARLDYQVSQGELKQARVQIPVGQRLLRVEGESIRNWEMKDDVLSVELLKGVSPTYTTHARDREGPGHAARSGEGRNPACPGSETRDRSGGFAGQ